MRKLLLLTCIGVVLASCSPTTDSTGTTVTSPPPSTTTTRAPAPSTTTTVLPDFAVTSPAFRDGGAIPVEYTCDGTDTSPELNIVGIPISTASLVMIVADPDAPLGTWYHWVEFDIAGANSSLDLPAGTTTVGVPGVNSWHLEGYLGPCPPEGEEHQYVFGVYALGTTLDLPAGVDAVEVIAAMSDHVISTAELVGTYSR
ncbi:MAG: YbhB/YbcL family Raf kinase inhibitor-like protein [Acidimicrobiia bacterium]